MSSEITLVQCPRCGENWIDEGSTEPVCSSCTIPLEIDLIVYGVHKTITNLEILDFSQFTPQHLQILKSSYQTLEGVINVLEKWKVP